MPPRGPSRRELFYPRANYGNRQGIFEEINKIRGYIDDENAAIDRLSDAIDSFYDEMNRTSKYAPEGRRRRQEIYEAIQGLKGQRDSAYEMIRRYRDDIADLKLGLG